MKRERQLALALILIVTAVVAVTIYVRLPHTHDLNRLAKVVPGTSNHGINDYSWIDASTMIAFQDMPVATVADAVPTFNAFAINTATGKSTPLPALSTLADATHERLFSPDGQWVLSHKWVGWGKVNNEGETEYNACVIHVVKADGSRAITHKIYSNGCPLGLGWLDNHHYVLYLLTQAGLGAQIYDMDGTGPAQTIPFYDPQAVVEAHIESGEAHIESGEAHVESGNGTERWLTTSDQHLLLIGGDEAEPMQAAVWDVDLHFNPAHVKRWAFPLPKGAAEPIDGYNIVPSSDGKRIAWVLHFDDRYVRNPNVWKQFWNVHIQHKPRLLPEHIPTQEIWVSSIDGRGMHQIAYQADTGDSSLMIIKLKWSSDGKSLSFMRIGSGIHGAGTPIYTIPAD